MQNDIVDQCMNKTVFSPRRKFIVQRKRINIVASRTSFVYQ